MKDMPSVSRADGTVCSTRDRVAISDGAIAKPARKSRAAISQTASTRPSGAMPRVSAAVLTLSRVEGPFVHWMAPVITPASRLPSAQKASSTPVTPGTPCSSANATVVTSAEPNSDPSASATTASGSTVRHGILGATTSPSAVATLGWAGGSVARWAARKSVPLTPARMAAVRPATGSQAVASTVTRIGPTMNTASSTTDSRAYAVCTCRGSSSTCDQRARTQVPTGGSISPATTASAKTVQRGHSPCTEAMNSASAAPHVTISAGSTRRCPSRSRYRPWRIDATAFAIVAAPATDPAYP